MTPRDVDELFLDVHDRQYRALYFVTGNSHNAEDLMQDAFLKLRDRWDSVETIEDPTAYLFRAAFNWFRMRARRARIAAPLAAAVGAARVARGRRAAPEERSRGAQPWPS